MPRYFFNVHDGIVLKDDVGTNLPSRAQVYAAALERAASVLRDYPEFWSKAPWILEVTDENGASVLKIGFQAAVLDPRDVPPKWPSTARSGMTPDRARRFDHEG